MELAKVVRTVLLVALQQRDPVVLAVPAALATTVTVTDSAKLANPDAPRVTLLAPPTQPCALLPAAQLVTSTLRQPPALAVLLDALAILLFSALAASLVTRLHRAHRSAVLRARESVQLVPGTLEREWPRVQYAPMDSTLLVMERAKLVWLAAQRAPLDRTVKPARQPSVLCQQ